MAPKNPLGKIKDLARGAASVGLHVAGQATSLTAGAVNKLVPGKKPTIDSPETKAPEPAPRPALKTAPPQPETADVEHVDVTPADVARKMARKAPARPAAKKKAPAKKTTSPGAKLPPRKKVKEPRPDVTA